MQARNAASVLPDPVGAEINVVRPASMCGHPCSCGSVGGPNRCTNHSATRGWAQAREEGKEVTTEIFYHAGFRKTFALCRTSSATAAAGSDGCPAGFLDTSGVEFSVHSRTKENHLDPVALADLLHTASLLHTIHRGPDFLRPNRGPVR